MIKKVNSREELKLILDEFDKYFVPTVSSIVGSLDEYSNKLFKNAETIVFVEDNKVLGFASFYCNNMDTKVAYLSQIAVRPECGSMGIGTLLIKECERISKENGMKKLRLEVYNDNIVGNNFYKKNNYTYESDVSDKSKYMIKNL